MCIWKRMSVFLGSIAIRWEKKTRFASRVLFVSGRNIHTHKRHGIVVVVRSRCSMVGWFLMDSFHAIYSHPLYLLTNSTSSACLFSNKTCLPVKSRENQRNCDCEFRPGHTDRPRLIVPKSSTLLTLDTFDLFTVCTKFVCCSMRGFFCWLK